MTNLLSGLNSAQREIVAHVEGPLLIIAGAGTGKTRVLTHRIAHLIESGAAQPEDILALTFTEKATREMQERLDILLPYGYQELWVKTFHGFCDALLRERGLEMGLDTAYQLLPQTEFMLFLKDNLFEFDLNHYRPLGNPLRFIGALATYFGQLRDEQVQPSAYRDYADKLLSQADDEVERAEAERQVELAQAYVDYDRLVRTKGKLDFASLNYLLLELLDANPHVLKDLQKRFKFILVDEFQDTNTIQNTLVERLAADHQNLMVVGDDDQSIYKWRGASLSNILQFESNFPRSKKVVMTENYRSTQPILDMSHAVVQNNNPLRLEAREGLDKRLKSCRNFSDDVGQPKPHVIHFENYLQEVQFIIEEIERVVAKTPGRSYRDCAILVRATSHALPFVDELNRRQLPYHFSGAQGLYQRPEIKDLLAFMRSLANPYDDLALFRVLSLSVFGFEMGYLISLIQQAKRTSTPLLKHLRTAETTPDLFSSLGAGSSLTTFLESYQRWQAMAQESPASHIIGHFLKDSGYLEALESQDTDPEAMERLHNIATFSQIIKNFEETHMSPGLLECLEHVLSRLDLGDQARPPEEALDDDSIKVLTIHAAKGLEFDTVFMVDLVQHRFPTINRRDPLPLPEELISTPEETTTTHLHEERRLFYVAATRAQRQLFLTYSNYYNGKKRWKPSCFVAEAQAESQVDFTEDGTKLLDQSWAPVAVQAVDADESDKSVVFNLAKSHRALRLSYSRINTFETCPLKYKFRYFYGMAEPMSHAASFGSSVHNALNAFYQEIKEGRAPELDRLKVLYEKHWIPLGYTSRAHHNKRKLDGWAMLETFFTSNSSDWIVPAYLERPFTLKVAPGLTVSGRIDRIDRLSDGTYEVIDYKTGRLRNEKAVHKDLQLSIYALACRDIFNLDVSKLSLYYLLDGQKLVTERSPDQISSTVGELKKVADAIRTSSFEATPSSYICGYCDYNIICNQSAA